MSKTKYCDFAAMEVICGIPGSVQGEPGWGSEQPGLEENAPAHGSGVAHR